MSNKLGGGGGSRQPTIIPATNDIRQRVLSARRLRVKTFQNQLADAQQTIAVSLSNLIYNKSYFLLKLIYNRN